MDKPKKRKSQSTPEESGGKSQDALRKSERKKKPKVSNSPNNNVKDNGNPKQSIPETPLPKVTISGWDHPNSLPQLLSDICHCKKFLSKSDITACLKKFSRTGRTGREFLVEGNHYGILSKTISKFCKAYKSQDANSSSDDSQLQAVYDFCKAHQSGFARGSEVLWEALTEDPRESEEEQRNQVVVFLLILILLSHHMDAANPTNLPEHTGHTIFFFVDLVLRPNKEYKHETQSSYMGLRASIEQTLGCELNTKPIPADLLRNRNRTPLHNEHNRAFIKEIFMGLLDSSHHKILSSTVDRAWEKYFLYTGKPEDDLGGMEKKSRDLILGHWEIFDWESVGGFMGSNSGGDSGDNGSNSGGDSGSTSGTNSGGKSDTNSGGNGHTNTSTGDDGTEEDNTARGHLSEEEAFRKTCELVETHKAKLDPEFVHQFIKIKEQTATKSVAAIASTPSLANPVVSFDSTQEGEPNSIPTSSSDSMQVDASNHQAPNKGFGVVCENVCITKKGLDYALATTYREDKDKLKCGLDWEDIDPSVDKPQSDLERALVGVKYNIKDFVFHKFLGGTSSSKVFLVRLKCMPKVLMAMKIVGCKAEEINHYAVDRPTASTAVPHQNIVKCFGFFAARELVISKESPFTLVFVMEPCGRTLRDFISSKDLPMEPFARVKTAVEVMYQILQGIEAMHSHKDPSYPAGIIPLDLYLRDNVYDDALKPDNIYESLAEKSCWKILRGNACTTNNIFAAAIICIAIVQQGKQRAYLNQPGVDEAARTKSLENLLADSLDKEVKAHLVTLLVHTATHTNSERWGIKKVLNFLEENVLGPLSIPVVGRAEGITVDGVVSI